jgi:hypothetical protein
MRVTRARARSEAVPGRVLALAGLAIAVFTGSFLTTLRTANESLGTRAPPFSLLATAAGTSPRNAST